MAAAAAAAAAAKVTHLIRPQQESHVLLGLVREILRDLIPWLEEQQVPMPHLHGKIDRYIDAAEAVFDDATIDVDDHYVMNKPSAEDDARTVVAAERYDQLMAPERNVYHFLFLVYPRLVHGAYALLDYGDRDFYHETVIGVMKQICRAISPKMRERLPLPRDVPPPPLPKPFPRAAVVMRRVIEIGYLLTDMIERYFGEEPADPEPWTVEGWSNWSTDPYWDIIAGNMIGDNTKVQQVHEKVEHAAGRLIGIYSRWKVFELRKEDENNAQHPAFRATLALVFAELKLKN